MGTRQSNSVKSHLTLSGATAIHDAVVATRRFAESHRASETDRSRLAIIVEELVTNLYDHGGLGPDDTFDLELTAGKADIALVLTAPGREFDPTGVAARSQFPARGGGAGLELVKAWSRQINHRYADGRNRIELSLPAA